MKTIFKIFIFLSLFLLAAELDAQNAKTRSLRRLNTDISFGLNLSQFDVKDGDTNNRFRKYKPGFQVALYISYKFYKDFQLQTGFMVSQKGLRKEQYSYFKDAGNNGESIIVDKITKIDASYMQFPFNIGWEHFFTDELAWNIHLGFYVAYGIKGDRRVEGEIMDADTGDLIENLETGKHRSFKRNSLKRFDGGLNASTGIVYDIYTIKIGYEHGLSNISDQAHVKYNTRNMYLALGFRF